MPQTQHPSLPPPPSAHAFPLLRPTQLPIISARRNRSRAPLRGRDVPAPVRDDRGQGRRARQGPWRRPRKGTRRRPRRGTRQRTRKGERLAYPSSHCENAPILHVPSLIPSTFPPKWGFSSTTVKYREGGVGVALSGREGGGEGGRSSFFPSRLGRTERQGKCRGERALRTQNVACFLLWEPFKGSRVNEIVDPARGLCLLE